VKRTKFVFSSACYDGAVMMAFRFRVYPTAEQAARYGKWNDALRFLWNLAHEQRLMGLCTVRDRKRYYTAFDQQLELTDLRAELPWLNDVPRNVCSQLLVELDKAWQRSFKRLAAPPHFKKRGRDGVALCEPHPRAWTIVDGHVRFPKLGVLRTVMHRPIKGTPKTCSLVRDGDAWFVSIVSEMPEAVPPPGAATGPAVAVNRSEAVLIADSDGRSVDNPKHLSRSLARLERLKRSMTRKKKASKNREKANGRLARLHRKVRRQRDHQLHVQSSHYAKHHGVVVVYDVNAHGQKTVPEDSKDSSDRNVTSKARLNRAMLDAAWGRFATMLDYKLKWRGGVLLKLPAHDSLSQTCAGCEQVSVGRKAAEARFSCSSCGHEANADVNDARVLLSRGIHGAAACGGLSERKPVKQELRVARRGTQRRQGSSPRRQAPC
jgi:putative transposase